MPGVTLDIPEANVEFYVASLARGILMAMKSGAIATEVGIWSLGRCVFQQALQGCISAELTAILDVFDELDALEAVGGDVQATLDRLLLDLEACQQRSAAGEATDFWIKSSQQ